MPLALWVLMEAGASSAVELYSSLGQVSSTTYRLPDTSRYYASRIPMIENFEVRRLTLRMAVDSGEGASIKVCDQAADTFAPDLSKCSAFTAQVPITPFLSDVTFSGSHRTRPNGVVWVILSPTAPNARVQWEAATGTSISYVKATTGSINLLAHTFLMSLEGEPLLLP